ncbi:MAG: CspA family cold shock protein [Methylobacterium mesophilicum]|nr:CspA family cold shock protein [Methylobacterium mesophilicum]
MEDKGSYTHPEEGLLEPGEQGVTEVAGTIKWFDVAKGYGFILPDTGEGGDVLLHVTCLRRDGFQTAPEGSRVVCLVKQGDRGRQAFRVVSMDTSSAIHPSELPTRAHSAVAPESGLERALVKWFNRTKGFGFLTRGEGTEDIFIHMETLRRFGIAELRPGQVVLIRFGRGTKGLTTAEIHPDLGTLSASH